MKIEVKSKKGLRTILSVIVDKKTGEVIDSFVKTSIAKENDYAIYGKDGSDIIFTEAGVSLRGGKFIPRTIKALWMDYIGRKLLNRLRYVC